LAPFGICQQSSQQNQAQFNEPELRTLYDQLIELKAGRKQLIADQQADARDKASDERERAIAAREIELEKQAADLAGKERDIAIEQRDLAQEQVKFYKNAWEQATRKTGIGCRLKRIFTLGFARCR
jgi:hypothetical protein